AVHYKDSRFILSGETSFRNFVNKTCSHLIITLANSLSLEKPKTIIGTSYCLRESRSLLYFSGFGSSLQR
ncbi:hypothetical protein LIY48_26295, partial [Escherichia coli]|nr:hypothetical protein [Escherichia coli]